MAGCVTCFDRALLRPGDTQKEVHQRRVLLPAFLVCTVGSVLGIISRGHFGLYTASWAVAATGFAAGAAAMLIRLRITLKMMVSIIMLPVMAGILMADVAQASRVGTRAWIYTVLVMDTLLSFDAYRSVQYTAMGMALVFIAVGSAESAAHFGLYDLEFDGGLTMPYLCNCVSPPCKRPWPSALLLWFSTSCVILIDFIMTRHFAEGLHAQLRLVASSVRVSETLTALLADYATEDARREVAKEGDALPAKLRASYEKLLDNLDSYRAFLPDSLLQAASERQQQQQQEAGGAQWDEHQVTVRAPGLGVESPQVAVCFTDIQSSTELWEAHPQGMYEGLNLHNRAMRETYAACAGYEVKTIGDSFMVAFRGSVDALRFGLQAQQRLLAQQWPLDLLRHPLCTELADASGGPLWGGLRVRIGVQYGPVRAECNPVTGRCDYFGHTVNTAARLEAVLRKGGLVATSQSVVEALGAEEKRELGHPVLRDAGDRELKGVREAVQVWALVPQQLSGRLAVLAEAARPSTSDSGPLHVPSPLAELEGSRSDAGDTPSRASSGTLAAQGSSITARQGRLALRLRRSAATAATARLPLRKVDQVVDAHAIFVAAAALAADKTLGVVDCVLSACVAVTWNASRPCAAHPEACCGFLAGPFRVPCHLGAASGGVLHGSVAAGRRSFAAVVGGCVELATAMAEEAERCGDIALAAGAVGAHCAASGTGFCAQLWCPAGGVPFTAYEVFPEGREGKWTLADMEDEDLNPLERSYSRVKWGDSMTAAFHAACAAEPGSGEEAEVLRQLGDLGEDPGGARNRLVSRIRKRGVRCRHMPPLVLWESGDIDSPTVAASECGELLSPSTGLGPGTQLLATPRAL